MRCAASSTTTSYGCRIEHVLREHAVWTARRSTGRRSSAATRIRVQWCHGAPGIVATLGDLLPEDLLLGGAETTWRTGPLDKGPRPVSRHGRQRLRAARRRTSDAATRCGSSVPARSPWTHSSQLQGRYSLFTGDIGAALFAQACIDVDPRFPILDVL